MRKSGEHREKDSRESGGKGVKGEQNGEYWPSLSHISAFARLPMGVGAFAKAHHKSCVVRRRKLRSLHCHNLPPAQIMVLSPLCLSAAAAATANLRCFRIFSPRLPGPTHAAVLHSDAEAQWQLGGGGQSGTAAHRPLGSDRTGAEGCCRYLV